jgi:ADP-ribosylglycohydrolase
MIGAIIGDVIGSVFEWHNVKTTEFELFSRESKFTDDTVMTIALADALLSKQTFRNPIKDEFESRTTYTAKLKQYGHRYPDAGYGNMFNEWIKAGNPKPYKSYGNGSAMRVSPIGFAANTLQEVLKESKRSARVTHNHHEGIKGAQAVASAVFLANNGESKENIKLFIERKFKYNLNRKLDDIRPTYKFDSSCQGSVPEAIVSFLESVNFEDAIRKAISLGGDSDTIACITGGLAQAYYKKIPAEILNETLFRLDNGMKMIIKEFNKKYKIQY